MIKEIELLEEDTFDPNCTYALLRVEEEDKEYCLSAIQRSQAMSDIRDYSDHLINKEDMSELEYTIARQLFLFLWNSENGTNTNMSYDQLLDGSITIDKIENFIKKFNLGDSLEMDEFDEENLEDNGIEIYWDYLCRFNFKTCNFWED